MRTTRFGLALAALALSTLNPSTAAGQASPGPDGTYLIKGGTVVAPDGQKTVANILVRDNRIAQVGPNVTGADAQVIDATGKLIYQIGRAHV